MISLEIGVYQGESTEWLWNNSLWSRLSGKKIKLRLSTEIQTVHLFILLTSWLSSLILLSSSSLWVCCWFAVSFGKVLWFLTTLHSKLKCLVLFYSITKTETSSLKKNSGTILKMHVSKQNIARLSRWQIHRRKLQYKLCNLQSQIANADTKSHVNNYIHMN